MHAARLSLANTEGGKYIFPSRNGELCVMEVTKCCSLKLKQCNITMLLCYSYVCIAIMESLKAVTAHQYESEVNMFNR